MRYTLLELVQDILSSMDSDAVNSITDTVESEQVVTVIKTVYDDIQSRAELPIQTTLFTLTASGDSTKPVLMTKPTTIDHIQWIKYNKVESGDTDPVWTDIQYLPIEEFMTRTQVLLPSDTDVSTMSHTANGFNLTFHYRTDTGPTYYTSFNDNTIIFDAHDSTVDSTLQSVKTLCYGELTNIFTESDSWVPNLQPQQFALLLNEAKALAHLELRQMQHPRAELMARRNWIHLQKDKRTIPFGTYDVGPNYGRRGPLSSRIPKYLRNGD